MCDPKDTKRTERYTGCGHRLPAEACDYYSYAHHKCYAAPDVAKKVNCYQMKQGEIFTGLCRFCREGKDLEGVFKYGAKWQERGQYLNNKR